MAGRPMPPGYGGPIPNLPGMPRPANGRGMGDLPPEREWTHPYFPAMRQGPVTEPVMQVYPPRTPDQAQAERNAQAQVIADGIRRTANCGTTLPVELSPREGIPFHGEEWRLGGRALIYPPAADTDATAGAAALLAAATRYGTANFTAGAVPAAVSSPIQLFFYRTPPGRRVEVERVYVRFADWGAEGNGAILWQVDVGGSVEIEPQSTGTRGVLETRISVAPSSEIAFVVRNRDVRSATLVEVLLWGWSYPVMQSDDTLRSTIMRQGFGPDSNGSLGAEQGCLPCAPGGQ